MILSPHIHSFVDLISTSQPSIPSLIDSSRRIKLQCTTCMCTQPHLTLHTSHILLCSYNRHFRTNRKHVVVDYCSCHCPLLSFDQMGTQYRSETTRRGSCLHHWLWFWYGRNYCLPLGEDGLSRVRWMLRQGVSMSWLLWVSYVCTIAMDMDTDSGIDADNYCINIGYCYTCWY